MLNVSEFVSVIHFTLGTDFVSGSHNGAALGWTHTLLSNIRVRWKSLTVRSILAYHPTAVKMLIE